MSVLEKYKIDKEEWHYCGQWEQPLLSASFWINWYHEELCDKIDIENSGRLLTITGYFLDKKEDREIMRKRIEKAIDNNEQEYFDTVNKLFSGLLDDLFAITPLLEKCKEADAGLFKEYIRLGNRAMVTWYLTFAFSEEMGDLLVERGKKLGVNSSMIVNAMPKKETLLMKQYSGALKIKKLLEEKGLDASLDEIKKDKEVYGVIKEHVKEFEWVGTHHAWGDPLTVEKFLEDIKQLKENPEVKGEDVPDELKFAINAAGDISYLRQYAAELFDVVIYKARPMLVSIGEKFGLSYSDLVYLTNDEIIDLLDNGGEVDKDKIELRKKKFFITLLDGKEVVVEDQEEIKELIKELVPQGDYSVKEFKGMIACKGKAKGTVKVFLIPEEMDKMKQGDVLVTTMTTPDFVPLMQKASAIVTDIGGLLSHAAIVSREMGKPCIIGTKVGTKVLKDGDEVEVDASKGVVRKL